MRLVRQVDDISPRYNLLLLATFVHLDVPQRMATRKSMLFVGQNGKCSRAQRHAEQFHVDRVNQFLGPAKEGAFRSVYAIPTKNASVLMPFTPNPVRGFHRGVKKERQGVSGGVDNRGLRTMRYLFAFRCNVIIDDKRAFLLSRRASIDRAASRAV